MHQPSHFFGRGRQAVDAGDQVHRLDGGQVMTDGADTTETLDQDRHFPVGATLNKTFEATEFDDVQAGLLDLLLFVEQDGDFAVTLDPGDRFDDDFSGMNWFGHENRLLNRI